MRGEKILEKIFASLNDLSISTSIDDFGTGYSSLSYIQQFSFNRLKIAKELIDKISTDCSNNHIVEAIVVMSKSLKVATIAEGVENYEQVNILKDIGCDEIQGYVFSKPLPAKELEYNFSSVAAKFILFTTMTLWFVIQFFMDMNLILMELQLNFYDKDKYYLKILCIMKPVISDNIF
ncbi:diguanylate cyclase/phosphodiesterase (GGDEF & EAL domain) with PAS/PAC sensor(s) [Clostridium sp. IBUN22A]|nr:diguanylate cyclase/phosphodiesterase (GGDEF & EAL domain) with PAS/PAC sensor(s) [Clostridium sp. IBUN22A]